MSINRQILVTNQSPANYRLISTRTQFNRIIRAFSQYSFAVPFILNSFTQYQLLGSNGKILNFVIDLNGEVEQADRGLVIGSITNGVTLEFFGFEGLGTVQLENNLITILA